MKVNDIITVNSATCASYFYVSARYCVHPCGRGFFSHDVLETNGLNFTKVWLMMQFWVQMNWLDVKGRWIKVKVTALLTIMMS